VAQDFYDVCGGRNIPGPATDLTDIFNPCRNTPEEANDNDCDGTVGTRGLYVLVQQHA
jgi:hypothetical protein